MFKRVVCFLLIFSLILNVYHFTKVQAMSVSAVAGIGILASMLIAGGYLVYQNRDSAFALLSNVWDSLPPRTRDAILWPWESGRKVVRFGSEVWSEVVSVLLEKKGLSLRSEYDLPVSASSLDLSVLSNYHYYEVLDTGSWRYWYMLYPASASGQFELVFQKTDNWKFVITLQSTEGMSPEPYMIRVDRYRFVDGQYSLVSSIERAGSYIGIYRDYHPSSNAWGYLYMNIYDSQGSRVGYDYFYTAGYNCFLSILDGSFSYKKEVFYNPAAGDVEVSDSVLPGDAATKDVAIPNVSDLSGLMSFLSKLVGVTSDGYREVVDLTRGISDYVGSIYDVLTSGLTNLVSGVRNIVDTLTSGILGVLQGIWDFLKSILDSILGVLQNVWDFLRSILGSISEVLQGIWDFLKSILGSISGVLQNVWSSLQSLVSGVSSIVDILTAGLIGDLSIDYSPLMDLPITNKFPFSLPFDVYNAISGFTSEGDLPEINFGFYDPVNKRIIDNRIDLGSIDFIVDYAPYVRAVFLFVYILGLVYATRILLGGGV